MKALSLTQPWASVILHQGKRIENRTRWSGCSFRGPILLHAAKSTGTLDDFDKTCEDLLDIGVPQAFIVSLAVIAPDRAGRPLWRPRTTLPRGGIVGRAHIAGFIRTESDIDEYVRNGWLPADQRRWWCGGFALVLADVEPLPFVPWRGELGLFDVPESALQVRP